ncbi:MAG: hypothetical protein IKC33_03580 [Clostridia bacterium]|nr:hypothetical protein [Clostridia bacterium]
MKVFGLKYKVLLGTISVLFLSVDLFLIAFYRFEGQLLIFLYIMIGLVPLCGVFALCSNTFIPSISFDYNAKTIITDFVANELYKNDRHFRNQGDVLHFDEITNCEIDNKKLILTFKYDQVKTLYLSFFTKSQIHKIYNEIKKIINLLSNK